jgi:hypothetical protein
LPIRRPFGIIVPRLHHRADKLAKRAFLDAVGSHQEAGGAIAEQVVEAWFAVLRDHGAASALDTARRPSLGGDNDHRDDAALVFGARCGGVDSRSVPPFDMV